MTYTTQFGSLDNTFKPHHKDQYVTVPDGVAHFLEHKLFEKTMMKIYLLHLPMIMLKSMHLQVLIARVICLVQLIKLNEIFYVYLIWWKHPIFQKKQ